jgi:thioredoxin 1
MENKTTLEVQNLQLEGKKLMVVYYGTWCNVCTSLLPALEDMSTNYSNVTFVKVDVDQNSDDANSLNIQTVPTIMIYDGETLINRSTGANVLSVYTKILDRL